MGRGVTGVDGGAVGSDRVFRRSNVIVTGGGSGIGAALGRELVAQGAHVVLADIDPAALEATTTAIRRSVGLAVGQGSVSSRSLDVRDGDAFTALVDDVADRNGSIDLLFNNAGISIGGPTHELSRQHWDRIIDINLRGVVNGVLAAYPRMVAQGGGHIVNTASAAGLVAPPFAVSYATTKHAVVGLSTGLRPEAALHGVRVSALCPGAVDTPILDAAPSDELPPTASAPVTARQFLEVLHQKPMEPDAFARGALRGVARNKAIIVVPREAAALWYLFRLSPRATEAVATRIARTAAKRLVRPAPPLEEETGS